MVTHYILFSDHWLRGGVDIQNFLYRVNGLNLLLRVVIIISSSSFIITVFISKFKVKQFVRRRKQK